MGKEQLRNPRELSDRELIKEINSSKNRKKLKERFRAFKSGELSESIKERLKNLMNQEK